MAENAPDVHDKLMATLKRRGYLQPSYEIYGGVAGFYDYGPLGARLKLNIEDLWREFYVLREGMAEIQCPTISPAEVFKASGHLDKFADTLIECASCGTGVRADHFLKAEYRRFTEGADAALAKMKGLQADEREGARALVAAVLGAARTSADQDPNPENVARLMGVAGVAPGETRRFGSAVVEASSAAITLKDDAGKTSFSTGLLCPGCQAPLREGTRIYPFNLMFRTSIGPGSGRTGYLRPETAQGMFMDFDWLYRYHREKLPFGAVQLGKAFRNEISPRQSLLRLREFHQMEAEVFFDPKAKSWPRFADLKDRVLRLVPKEAQERGEESVVEMTVEKAVESGVVANGALGYFLALTDVFLTSAGLRRENLRFRQHLSTEKAHYSTDTWDAEFLSPRFGWVEIVGIADRTDYDLKAHERVSGVELKALRRFPEPREVEVNKVVPVAAKLGPRFKGKAAKVADELRKLHPDHAEGLSELEVTVDGERLAVPAEAFRIERGTERVEGETYTPHVVEPSYGIDRIFYAVLEGAYAEREWAVLRLPPKIAPVKAGVFPLMARDGLDDLAAALERELRTAGLLVAYDDSGSIGKRYARQDEIGTPFCVTVDYETQSAGTVTVRDRDTAEQVRVARRDLVALLGRLVRGETSFAEIPGPRVGAQTG